MGEHLVDHLITPESLQSPQEAEVPGSSRCHTNYPSTLIDMKDVEECGGADEEEPLIQMVECRICQEEDSIQSLEIPCACSGSLKTASDKPEEGEYDVKSSCPLCPGRHTCYNGRDKGSRSRNGSHLDLHDPRLLAMAAAERRLLEAQYAEYADANASGAAFYRAAVLILMALLLLRHALTITTGDDDDDDDASTIFSLFLLRAAGFLLPCYIIAWAISILQRRRQRQEAAAALAATEVAFMIEGAQHRGLQVTVAPGPAPTPGPAPSPHQEPVQ
ncbi:RING/FYVE/PHD zinc finger superfamily protein [Actinidia rufa]|uniref:RING/FYVE/PHD zinc finger superfamily protein n=1 Tax=Actinidia rufa TaxID=165716 RepID=A0A7J0GMR1_9ERIC|nr:RING/FYVE/PHD zinc finger superfamily protein [Actinidia rufa]